MARRSSAVVQVREIAADMEPKFLECRDLMHPWVPHRARRVGRAYERTLFCPRCTAEKDQQIDSQGTIVSSRIRYPEGYVMKGVGHLRSDARAELRLASIQGQVRTGGWQGEQAVS